MSMHEKLMAIDGVTDVEYDNSARELNQTIFLIKYAIKTDEFFYKKRKELTKRVIEVAEAYGLVKSQDTIEDYGEHLYFVFEGVI